jgi:hypothetical protein
MIAGEGDEISSHSVVPYVGMMFDNIEVAKQVYNDYAYKLGFGIRIGNTKFCNAPRDLIISRDFECVHAGNLKVKQKASAAKIWMIPLI